MKRAWTETGRESQSSVRAWIAAGVLAHLVANASEHSPRETGGLLLGYWTAAGEDVVITDWIGPGPRARHSRTAFNPDHTFHEREVARRYLASQHRVQYLGDWHSHPGGQAYLSDRDRATVARIAAAKEARAPTPLMLIIAGETDWTPSIWVGRQSGAMPRFARWLSYSRIRPEQASLTVF